VTWALAAAAGPSPSPAAGAGPAAQVIVASGDQLTRSHLASALRGDGHRVCAIPSGLQVLQRLGRQRGDDGVDALLLDITAAPWVGVALLRTALMEDWTLPVLVVSSGSPSVRAALEELGVRVVFERPLELEAIRRAVGSALVARLQAQRLRVTTSAPTSQPTSRAITGHLALKRK
jgi:DNA-binding NtrC family response regulator